MVRNEVARGFRFGASVLALVLLVSCGASDAERDGGGTAGRLTAVQVRGRLLVCSTGDYRPFTYRDAEGRWSGIDVDMARQLAQELGVRAEFVPTTWEALVDDFTAGCDIAVGGVSTTPERAERTAFSAPYVQDGKTPITRCADVERFAALERIDRPGVRVVVNPGGTNQEFAERSLQRAELVEHPDNNTIFQEIVDGRADLMMTDATETRWQANEHPELCAVHPDRPFTSSEKVYLLPRGDEPFRRFVDGWLAGALRDGTYARIAEPWIG